MGHRGGKVHPGRAALGAARAVALWTLGAGALAAQPLAFFGDRSLPPFEYLVDGEPRGATVDLARAVGRVLRRPVEIHLLPWAEAQARLLAGEGDALTQFGRSPQREEQFAFSRPLPPTEFALFVRAGSAGAFSNERLSGRRIGGAAGGLPRQWLARERPMAELVLVDNLRDGVRQLLRGEIDAFAAPAWPALWLLEDEGIGGVTKLPPLFQSRPDIAVRRADTELLAQIDAALLRLERSGEIERINDRWSPERVYLFTGSTVWFGKLAASVTLAALIALAGVALLLWRQRSRLRAEVEQRRLAEARIHRFQTLTGALGQAATPEQVGAVVVDHAAGLVDSPLACVAQLSRSGREWQTIGVSGYAHEVAQRHRHLHVGNGLPFDVVVVGNAPLVFANRAAVLAAHPEWATALEGMTQGALYVAALRATPTSSGAALPIGALSFAWPQSRGFDAELLEQLAALTGLVAQALERAQLRSAEQRSAAMQAALQHTKSALGDVDGVAAACALIAREGAAHLGAVRGEVALFAVAPAPGEAPAPDTLLQRAGSGPDAPDARESTPLRVDADTPLARAAASGQPVYGGGEGAPASARMQVALPLFAHPVGGATVVAGATRIGAVLFEFEAPRELDPEERLFLETLAGIAARSIERCQLIERLRTSLQRSEAEHRQLDALVEQFPVGMIVVEAPSGRILRSSRAAAKIAGVAGMQAGEEIQAQGWRARRYPGEGAGAGAGEGSGQRIDGRDWPLARVLRTGEATAPELLELERPDGGRRIVDTMATPIRDGAGRMLAAAALFIDVTEQIGAQQRQRETDLRLSLAMASTGMGNWDFDLASGEGIWNAQMYRLLGMPAGDGREHGGSFMSHIVAQDRPGVEAQMARAFSEEGDFEATFRILRDDGELRWLLWRGRVLRGHGAGARMMGINLDVTPLMQAREQLESVNRQKDELLAMVSHELRNPLAPIASAAELLARAGEREAVRTPAVEVIQRQLKLLERLVDDLLEFSRIRYGRLELQREVVGLADAVAHACDSMRPLLERQRQTLVVELPPGEPLCVNADPQRLAQMVGNLIGNAAKYTPPGGRIEVSAQCEQGQCALRVRDNGRGIAPEFLPLIFDMFTQDLDSTGVPDSGLGLGLAIVKRLAELHGGTVVAESAGVGRGACFTLRLPAAHRAAVRAA
jgi:signal transduction histidine kinase/ABC-type amino acid transport substrate-binding protein/GAF domain-containing protein